MASNETNNDNENDAGKVQIGLRMEPELFSVISEMAVKEDRTMTNMIHRLLKQSPRVKSNLEQSETAGASA